MLQVDYTEIIRKRIKIYNKMLTDPSVLLVYQAYYMNRPVEWINDFCVTFDPRKVAPEPRLMPFILFPRQVEFVQFLHSCVEDKESGLVEKCRDVGATWLCCAYTIWMWLFRPGSVIGWGSRKEEYVDKKGDPKAIFPKLRQLISNLAPCIRPAGFSMDSHATYMKIINPVNGSVIAGEAGENMGRGGRTTIYFKDESAHYMHPEAIEAALGDNTDVQIDISSVNGSANPFYRRRMAGEIWEPNKPPTKNKTRVFVFDWRDHPAKTQEWYNARREKAEAEGLLHLFLQEVDRDYSGSQDKIIIRPEWVRAAIDAHIVLGLKDDGERVAGQDIADGGGDKNALTIRHGIVAKFATSWGGDAGDAAAISVPHCIEYSVDELHYDIIGVGAGFKAGINSLADKGAIPQRLKVKPWDSRTSPQDPESRIIPNDPESRTNADHFANLKAQSWWRLRTRFYKTHRSIHYGDKYPEEELISLPSDMPNLHQLQLELSQAVYTYDAKGRVVVDKQPEGSSSPNLADSAVICYNPIRRASSFDII